MMVLPRKARFALLKLELGSAEGVTRARARVWSGIFLERDSRECRAASLADCKALSGRGDGSFLGRVSPSSGICSIRSSAAGAGTVDWHRTVLARKFLLGMVAGQERAWRSCPPHREGRIPFMGAN